VAQVVTAVSEFGWAPAIALGVTLPALLLPDGRLRSRRWRVVVATAVAGATLAVVAGSLAPGPLENQPGGNQLGYQLTNPLGLPGAAGAVAGRSWCCGSAPPAGSSARSCAGSPPGRRPRWARC
jgi:hypothetical protein